MSPQTVHVLVTGANSGLGLGICHRLVDDFLATQPSTHSLTILFTTRGSRKAADTLSTLKAHLAKHQTPTARERVQFQPENVDLTNLLSVHDLARKLNASSLPRLDAIILNAGIGGWSGLNWPVAVRDILLDMRTATTWPAYKLGIVGLITKPQLPRDTATGGKSEPPLGEVFCANVLGHYMLAHWLMPLFRACPVDSPGKIIFVSSIEPRAYHYNPDDLQGLGSKTAYESSKRLTDLLTMTTNQSATAASVASFTSLKAPKRSSTITQSSRPTTSSPTIHTFQPGICVSSIVALYWILQQTFLLSLYFARLIGSPWATVSTYTGALSATWLAFASPAEIAEREKEHHCPQGGKIKWGTMSTRFGSPSVQVTDVDDWGINGTGESFRDTWWGGTLGRPAGAVDATKEDVEGFIELGAKAWKEMEQLRTEWEDRIEEYESSVQPSGHQAA